MFIIFALPRSRTAWISQFLTYGDWYCGHDEIQHMRSLVDIQSWLSQPLTGTVETSAAPWWRLISKYAPQAKVATIRRPVPEVVESLRKVGLPNMDVAMRKLDRKLDQIERRLPGVVSINFADLENEETCAKLFEHCLPYPHDPAHWAAGAKTNIQIHFPAMLRYCAAYKPQLDKLGKLATQAVRSEFTFRRTEPPAGMTFQLETFTTAYGDATGLFREHLMQTDQATDGYASKNISLLQRFEDLGMMQLLTARSNGRMFGYMLTLVVPSLDACGESIGIQTTFFAAPDCPGLGLKMEREALARLKERGVDEAQFRAGVLGNGPKMGALYKRVGAEEFGKLYRLRLK